MERVTNKYLRKSKIQEAKITSTKSPVNCLTTLTPNLVDNHKVNYESRSNRSPEQILEEKGIRIADSEVKNFSNVSPAEVATFYRSLGTWQDILPKTDYTYSPVSIYYTKKINDVIPVIPNMSRRNIWNQEFKNSELNSDINSYYSSNYSRLRKRWTMSGKVTKNSKSNQLIQPRNWKSVRTKVQEWAEVSKKFLSISHFSKTVKWTRESICTGTNISKSLLPLSFLVLFLLILFCLSLLSSDTIFKTSDVFCSPVKKVGQTIFSLVYKFYDFTFNSISFVLSSISWPSKTIFSSISNFFNFVFAPVYKMVLLMSSEFSTRSTSGESSSAIDDGRVEEVLHRILDSKNSHLVRHVISSSNFINFIDGKLKEFEEKQNDNVRKMVDEKSSQFLGFKDEINRLESLLLNLKVSEQFQELQLRLDGLKEEMRTMGKKVENDVVVLLSTVFKVQGDGKDFAELRDKFLDLIHSIEMAHLKIENLNSDFSKYASYTFKSVRETLDLGEQRIRFDLKEFVDELITRKMDEWQRLRSSFNSADANVNQLQGYVKEAVRKALEIYDADKTGMADYALESSGGIVLSTRCTETKKTNAQFSIFGIPLWHVSTSPRTVIQPGVHPGECWAFLGSTGYLVVQLSERIQITGFTLEHIPKTLAANETIDSAPKDFSVWALRYETDTDSNLLGEFQYNADGPSLQYYEAVKLENPYQIVELKILSNHGKIDYTCLYRFRVHGIPA